MNKDYELNIKKLLRFDDERGSIFVLERSSLPFEVKRAFITFHTEGERGGHAHLVAEELLICLKGSLEVQITSKNGDFNVSLSTPDTALYIPSKMYCPDSITFEKAILISFFNFKYCLSK